MVTGYDIAWRLVLAALVPACAVSPKFRRKVIKALRQRSAHDVPVAPASRSGPAHRATGPARGPAGADDPCVMVHAVSLGEINATRALVTQLAAARPDLRFLVTVTTDTGFARGRELYGADARVTLARYPIDLSGPVCRLLDRQRPSVVVLMELEVWPNFVAHCARRAIPVILINGRVTGPSYRGYRLGGPLVRRMFRRLADVCAQDAVYAERFRALGARADAVRVTGTMKFDTAQVGDRVPGDAELAQAVGLRPGEERVWVCGSTGPGEEAILLAAYRQLSADHPTLRLVVVPRHPERFDAVAALIQEYGFGVVRRSATRGAPVAPTAPDPATRGDPATPAVVLGDTMGELRTFYSLADVVLVGRTLVDLGARQRGSDMIEPAALGKAVVVGPWTHNFADAVRQFRQSDAMVELTPTVSAPDVASAVGRLLSDRDAAAAIGFRAREVVRSQQGATARHAAVILGRLPARTAVPVP